MILLFLIPLFLFIALFFYADAIGSIIVGFFALLFVIAGLMALKDHLDSKKNDWF